MMKPQDIEDLFQDLERRVRYCEQLAKGATRDTDKARLLGKEAAYRHARELLSNAALRAAEDRAAEDAAGK